MPFTLDDPGFESIASGFERGVGTAVTGIRDSLIKKQFKTDIDSGMDAESAYQKIAGLNPELSETLYKSQIIKQQKAAYKPILENISEKLGYEIKSLDELLAVRAMLEVEQEHAAAKIQEQKIAEAQAKREEFARITGQLQREGRRGPGVPTPDVVDELTPFQESLAPAIVGGLATDDMIEQFYAGDFAPGAEMAPTPRVFQIGQIMQMAQTGQPVHPNVVRDVQAMIAAGATLDTHVKVLSTKTGIPMQLQGTDAGAQTGKGNLFIRGQELGLDTQEFLLAKTKWDTNSQRIYNQTIDDYLTSDPFGAFAPHAQSTRASLMTVAERLGQPNDNPVRLANQVTSLYDTLGRGYNAIYDRALQMHQSGGPNARIEAQNMLAGVRNDLVNLLVRANTTLIDAQVIVDTFMPDMTKKLPDSDGLFQSIFDLFKSSKQPADTGRVDIDTLTQ